MRKERNASEYTGNSGTKFHKTSGQHPTALPLNQLTGLVIVYGEVSSSGQRAQVWDIDGCFLHLLQVEIT